MPRDDDELLDLLGRALEPPAVEPSLAEMHAFHRALAAHHRPRRRWAPRTMAVVVGLGALTTTGTAFAIDGHVPRPVRSVASSLGLPVDSPAVSDARAAMARLRAAIDHGDAEQIRAAAASGRARFNRLSERERRSLGSDAELAEAEASAPAVVGAGGPTADVRHGGSQEGDRPRPSEPSGHSGTTRPAPSGSDDGRRSGSGGSGGDHRSSPSTTRAPDRRSGDSGSGDSGSGGSSDGGSTTSSTTSTTSTIKLDSGSSGSGSSGSSGDGSGEATSASSGSDSGSGTGSPGGDH